MENKDLYIFIFSLAMYLVMKVADAQYYYEYYDYYTDDDNDYEIHEQAYGADSEDYATGVVSI